jgi:hypothetical protein
MDVDLEAVLARIQADRAEAEAQVRAAQDRLHDLVSKEAGVQVTINAIREYGESPPITPQAEQVPAQEPRWAVLNNMDAAVAALTEIGHPASTREIYEELRVAGRPEGFEQVRAALGYLKRKGKIDTPSRGLWQPPAMIESTAEAPAAVMAPQDAARENTPTGSNAASQILQGDTTRSWTTREVWAEQVRRGWAKPTDDARAAVRVALSRLCKREPRVQLAPGPTHAYRWLAELPANELAVSNGLAASHGTETTNEAAVGGAMT